jgi:hypothetical protein
MLDRQVMSNQKRSSRRDAELLLGIERYRALDTAQVQHLFFRFPTGQRKAQQRLLALTEAHKLTRTHAKKTGGYIYTLEEKAGLLEHLVALNWVRLWVEQSLHSWETLHAWNYEQDYRVLRSDAFCAVKNLLTGAYRFSFVELDRGTNKMDKIERYCKLYNEEGYASWWWSKLTNHFPPVLIVTTQPGRVSGIKRAIAETNSAGLEFEVRLLDDVREEVVTCCRS